MRFGTSNLREYEKNKKAHSQDIFLSHRRYLKELNMLPKIMSENVRFITINVV